MRCFVRSCLLLFFAAGRFSLAAQVGTDSVQQYIHLLQELSQAGNFEQAQLETVSFRAMLQRRQILVPAEAVPVLSGIYRHNEDETSALSFLADAARDARRDHNPETRARLLAVLVGAFKDWGQPEHVFACQQLLAATKDSLVQRDRRLASVNFQRQLDSLSEIRGRELAKQARYVSLDKEWAFLLGGGMLLAFLVLILAYSRSNGRWRKRLAKKELELEFLRSDRFTSTLPVEPVMVPGTELVSPVYERGSFFIPGGRQPEKTALVIEPNRQIVLYLKSLLADSFHVETAGTAAEGLQVAAELLPDLIVCDAVLNGKTGIDVVRQIKLSERTSYIPVILLSDHHGNEGKLDALRAGADAWFNRPVIDNEFDREVRRLLDSRKDKHEQFARCLNLYYSENRIAPDGPFLIRTVELIEQNLADPDFMADDLARKMQLNKQHYFKKLQVLTGKEPMQLIREMRLEKAKALLEKRAGTPQAISELVGFSSAGTFALAFKEYFGENTLLLHMPDRRSL